MFKHFLSLCALLLVVSLSNARYEPTAKETIERFFRTYDNLFRGLDFKDLAKHVEDNTATNFKSWNLAGKSASRKEVVSYLKGLQNNTDPKPYCATSAVQVSEAAGSYKATFDRQENYEVKGPDGSVKLKVKRKVKGESEWVKVGSAWKMRSIRLVKLVE